MADLVALLTKDHREVEALFEQYLSGPIDADVSRQLCNALEVHSRLEEGVVYPQLGQVEGGRDLQMRAEAEHRDVLNIIDGIRQIGHDHSEAVQRIRVLRDNVARHIAEEESEILPALQHALSPEDLDALGTQAEEERRALIEDQQRRVAAGAI